MKSLPSYTGVVEEGTKRAAVLGFPTVNIPLDDAVVSGIYVAKVVAQNETHRAVAFADQKRQVLEAHMLDTALDLYGEKVTIELLQKIRDSITFKNDDELRSAIASDIAKAQEYFKDV